MKIGKTRALLAAGALLALAAAARAAGDAEFTGALADVAARAAAGAAGLQAKARAAQVPELLARRARPDPSFTPGHLCTADDPNFKEYRYPEHIAYCQRNVTEQMKATVAAHYGIPKSEWSNYEFDHLIPLAIGGDSSVDNLWPEPHGNPDGSDGKDKLELQLYMEMKAGTVTQAGAVAQIYAWFDAADFVSPILTAAR